MQFPHSLQYWTWATCGFSSSFSYTPYLQTFKQVPHPSQQVSSIIVGMLNHRIILILFEQYSNMNDSLMTWILNQSCDNTLKDLPVLMPNGSAL